MNPRPRPNAPPGFSLLELLVSLVILAVLSALSFAAFGIVREGGQIVRCTGNLRQIYGAAIAFSFDHNGKLPPALGSQEMVKIDSRYLKNQYWWDRSYLARYILTSFAKRPDNLATLAQSDAAVFNCPARFKEGPDEEWQRSSGPAISYVMRFLGTSDPSRYQLSTMTDTSRKVYVTEGRSSTLAVASARTCPLGEHDSSQGRLKRYHRNGTLNLLFFDGHVEAFTGTDAMLAPMINLDE